MVNSADPHQTVPREEVKSGSSLFAILSVSLFGIIRSSIVQPFGSFFA